MPTAALNLPESPAAAVLGGGVAPAPKPLPKIPPASAAPPPMREFGDALATRKFIYEDTLNAAQNMEPLEDGKYRLHLQDVDWADPERFSRKQRKDAILGGETLARRMRGTWVLSDLATGQELQRRAQIVARVPYLSSLGTFTHRGNEYTVNHQQRLQPGIFARVKDNGEIESHVNVLPGEGVSHRYFLDPKKSLFKMRLQQAEMPLLPLLHHLGATDQEVRDAWGNDIYAENYKHMDSGGTIKKLMTKLLRKQDQEGDEGTRAQKLTQAIERMRIDPEVTQRTLGKPHATLNKEVILAATKKLLDINLGKAEPDDRDHAAYQRFYGPEDLFSERIRRDHGNLRKMLFRKIAAAGSLDKMPTGALTPQIEQVLLGSGLAQCFDDKTSVLTRRGWLLWSEVDDTDEFACRINGKIEYHVARRLFRSRYRGEMFGCRTDTFSYLVTPNHRCWATTVDTPHYRAERADQIFSHCRRFQVGFAALASPHNCETIVLPRIREDRHNNWLPEITVDVDAWLALMGWWLAEGWAGYDKRQREYRVTISQSKTVHPVEVREIAQILERLPFHFRYSDAGNEFVIRNKTLCMLLMNYGTKARKRIPRYIFELSEAKLRLLFDAYMKGDGNVYNTYKKSETVSEGLALDLVELVGRLGYIGRISRRYLSLKNPNWKDSFIVSIGKNPVAYATSSADAKRLHKPDPHFIADYDGFVYCAEVPGHLLYVMRDGKPHWSHNSLEEINPAEVLDKQSRITRMGEGGIPSMDAIPDEARSVQPSHMGFIDPLRTPESFKVGIDLQMSHGSRKGRDGRIYAQLRNQRTGKPEWRSPQDIADLSVATPDVFTDSFWKQQRRVPVMKGGKLTYVKREDVDYTLPNFEDAFSPLGNLVPLKSMVKGQRMSMASRMMTQALPLHGAQAPLVQSGMPGSGGSRSFEEEYGKHMGAVHAQQAGHVEKIDGENGIIHVRNRDGTKQEIELYQHHPFNRKSVTGSTVITVKRGSEFWACPIRDYEWKVGDLTLSIDPKTKQSAWMPVTGYMKHPNDKRLYRVTTDSGRSVVVTEDHSLITLNSAGEAAPILPSNCVIGRTRLPVARIPEQECGLGDHLNHGRLDGLYASEGHCPDGQPGLVIIAVQDDQRAERAMWVIKACGYSPYRNGGTVCFTDRSKYERLRAAFGHLAHNKCIPAWALNAPEQYRLGLVEGYMGGDGCLSEDSNGAIQVAAVSVSEKLRDGIVDLLSTLGVFVTLFDAPRNHLNENWRDGYGLRVISRHLTLIPRWFLYVDRERQFRDLLKLKYRSSPYEMVPVVDDKARKLLYAGFSKTPKYIHKTALEGAVAKHRLRKNDGVFGMWGRSDVMWDKIVDISPAANEEYVYDLCVQDAEMFSVCHGLIVHNTFIHQTPVVKPGDAFMPGQLLARSNYTDDTGATALGLNARVAYMAYQGYNFEDAQVISESMAKRMASEHMYQHDLEVTDRHKVGKNSFINLFPGKFDRKTLATLDEQGIVRPGTVIEYGQPVVLAAKERDRSENKIHKKRQAGYNDESILWKHHDPGVVTDVKWGKNGPVVLVKSVAQMQVGDKMSGRYGDKGVVSAIIPDSQMPHDKDGKPFEVLLNPAGTPSRTNPAQHVEAQLGKLAMKLGHQIKVPDFEDEEDMTEWAQKLLRQHGLTDTEDVVLPDKNMKIGGIQTGHRFFMKLHHTAESKGQGRGGGGYSMDETPSKGGEQGSKRVSMLDTNAMLSHGAVENLRDARLVKGQKNDQYWLDFMMGHTPVDPRVPRTYEKFVHQLKGSGINVVHDGTKTHLMAMTDKDIDAMAEDRRLKHGETVHFDHELKPVPGGLFDQHLTGGHGGKRWAAIDLPEPMPNPVMEEPIRHMLGLTQKKFQALIQGDEELAGYGSGPLAIKKALENINVDKEIDKAKGEYTHGRQSSRDMALRRWHYLSDAKRLGLEPKDWMLNKVPVLPPAFRPVSVMGDSGVPLVSDANYLYKELMDAIGNHKAMKESVGDTGIGPERAAIYQAFKAVTGLADPVHPKLQEKNVKGLLKTIFGSSPKFGTVQRKLLSSAVDNVGRAVITPNPDYDMDTVGLPENQAFNVYSKFIVRRLRRRGMPIREALRHVKDKSDLARDVLQEEMGERPVYINRAPVLHRFGIMAFKPKLVKGDVMQISPLIVKGFNADFDGDAMQFHVPTTPEATREAYERMLPSKNLLSPSDFKTPMHTPGQEYLGGLFAATSKPDKKKRGRVFRNQQDAVAAYERGDITADTPVQIIE